MRAAIERLEPASPSEAATVMTHSARMGTRLAFAGGGTHTIGRCERIDAVLSTRGLRGIVEYAAEDQTVTVEAGITFAALAEVLAAHGQRLAVDVAEPHRATIGGALAANAYGPRRMRFGSMKDLILGVGLVRADGTAVRAGGKVVKNVAGFDLSKLVVGSHGTLALITTATLRVHPLPQSVRAVRIARANAASVWTLVMTLREHQLEAVAVTAQRSTDGSACYDVDVVFEGFRAGVDAQIDALCALSRERGWSVDEIAPADARDADARARTSGPLRVRCTARPCDFASNDERAIVPFLAELESSVVSAYPALGTFTVAGTPKAASAPWEVVGAVRAQLEGCGGSLVVEAQPERGDLRLGIDPWGTPPPSFGLMRALKARFDPDARLAPGSFVGGL